ncbi:globin domain-containing protein [Yinghuangia soli]|uniref:nitric oxide dioxygenase n=1 Tax=Yinghuangia soli TaxID=2908204 RepID=A0AA41U063_9ACTN|nr:globin domain-containing protein [Yinghuangia soli]MCF2526112.1 FAD-binding oxidoreductase [Yinghuangia soli]
MTLDPRVLRQSFAIVERRGDRMAKYFYAHLFREHPGVRGLFPADMQEQRDRLFGALTAAVTHVDEPDVLVPFLQKLGADHRRFGALAAHYPAVGASLVATLKYFSGDAWSEEVETSWLAAYTVISDVMIAAAQQAEDDGEPAEWRGEVVARTRPVPSVAVLTVRIDPEYPYVPGQYLSVALHDPEVLNVWRQFSIGNAPRKDGTVDLHVRRIPGGAVSERLVDGIRVGDTLRIGKAMGAATLIEGSDRPLLFAAGGTGWGAVKALVEEYEVTRPDRAATLLLIARDGDDVYDAEAVEHLLYRCPKLEAWAILPNGARAGEEVPTALERHFPGPEAEAYLAGPPGMVRAAREWLTAVGGLPDERIRHDVQPEEFSVTRPLTPADWFIQRPPVPWIRRPE